MVSDIVVQLVKLPFHNQRFDPELMFFVQKWIILCLCGFPLGFSHLPKTGLEVHKWADDEQQETSEYAEVCFRSQLASHRKCTVVVSSGKHTLAFTIW